MNAEGRRNAEKYRKPFTTEAQRTQREKRRGRQRKNGVKGKGRGRQCGGPRIARLCISRALNAGVGFLLLFFIQFSRLCFFRPLSFFSLCPLCLCGESSSWSFSAFPRDLRVHSFSAAITLGIGPDPVHSRTSLRSKSSHSGNRSSTPARPSPRTPPAAPSPCSGVHSPARSA